MTRGESRKNAIMLLTKVIGKRPDKKWEDIIDFVHGLEYTAIKADDQIILYKSPLINKIKRMFKRNNN